MIKYRIEKKGWFKIIFNSRISTTFFCNLLICRLLLLSHIDCTVFWKLWIFIPRNKKWLQYFKLCWNPWSKNSSFSQLLFKLCEGVVFCKKWWKRNYNTLKSICNNSRVYMKIVYYVNKMTEIFFSITEQKNQNNKR